MVCQACGNTVEAGVNFCPRCGASAAASVPPGPPPPPQYAAYPQTPPPAYALRPPRVQRNLQMLGILWCLFGAYRVISGLIAIFVLQVWSFRSFGGGWEWGRRMGPHWMGPILPFIALIATVTAVLAFFVGFSLLRRRPWGRVLGIVVAVLSLLKFPIGTALGIYTLWVLAPAESGAEYDALADRT